MATNNFERLEHLAQCTKQINSMCSNDELLKMAYRQKVKSNKLVEDLPYLHQRPIVAVHTSTYVL